MSVFPVFFVCLLFVFYFFLDRDDFPGTLLVTTSIMGLSLMILVNDVSTRPLGLLLLVFSLIYFVLFRKDPLTRHEDE